MCGVCVWGVYLCGVCVVYVYLCSVCGGIHWWIEKGKKNQAFYVISVSVFGIIEE